MSVDTDENLALIYAYLVFVRPCCRYMVS